MTIHQQCVIHLAQSQGITLESAKFKYQNMDGKKRIKLQKKVKGGV